MGCVGNLLAIYMSLLHNEGVIVGRHNSCDHYSMLNKYFSEGDRSSMPSMEKNGLFFVSNCTFWRNCAYKMLGVKQAIVCEYMKLNNKVCMRHL